MTGSQAAAEDEAGPGTAPAGNEPETVSDEDPKTVIRQANDL
jgi:hypothetical protein